MKRLIRLPALALAGLFRLYQVAISPLFPPSCRYYPCCSSYGITALKRHGLIRGLALTTWRLVRCNPWSKGGVDHVPERWLGHLGRPAGLPSGLISGEVTNGLV